MQSFFIHHKDKLPFKTQLHSILIPMLYCKALQTLDSNFLVLTTSEHNKNEAIMSHMGFPDEFRNALVVLDFELSC
jgi:hypothetical protein